MSLQMWPFLQRARGWKLTVSVGVRALLFVKTARLLWGSRPQVPTLREKGWRPPLTCPFFADPRPLSSRGLPDATCTINRPRTGEQCSFATRNEKLLDSKNFISGARRRSVCKEPHTQWCASQRQGSLPRNHNQGVRIADTERFRKSAAPLRGHCDAGQEQESKTIGRTPEVTGTNCMSGAATCSPALKAQILSTSTVERALTSMIWTPNETHTTLRCFTATGICCR